MGRDIYERVLNRETSLIYIEDPVFTEDHEPSIEDVMVLVQRIEMGEGE